MDVGNIQDTGCLGQIDAAQIIDFVGELGTTVQGRDGAVDNKVRIAALEIGLNIFGFPEA